MLIDARIDKRDSHDYIESLVEALPYSQREIAARLGISRHSLGRYMGRVNPHKTAPYTVQKVLEQMK